MEIQDIRAKIRVGDYQLIADMTGYKRETVRMQLSGHRTLKDKTREAAMRVITNRELLISNNNSIVSENSEN